MIFGIDIDILMAAILISFVSLFIFTYILASFLNKCKLPNLGIEVSLPEKKPKKEIKEKEIQIDFEDFQVPEPEPIIEDADFITDFQEFDEFYSNK
jgi:hypothetical protein